MMAVIPPPVSGARTSQGPEKKITPKQKKEAAVQGLFQLAGFGLVLTQNYADAGAVAKFSPAISSEIVKLAEQNEKLGKTLEKLMEAGPYAGIMAACLPLALQIMINHDRIKAGAMPGIVPKATLEAQIKADLASEELMAMVEQREAEEKLAEAQRAYEDSLNEHA